MARIVALLLITTGISVSGATSTPQAPSSDEISRQHTRLTATETLPPAAIVAAVVEDVGTRPSAPASLPVPEATPVPERQRFYPEGAFDPGAIAVAAPVEALEESQPPVVDMPPPSHISIPAVGVNTTIVEVAPYAAVIDGQQVQMWNVADWAAGHHATSASPGEGGNIVIAGHDDVRGEVFRGLHDIEIGTEVQIVSPAGTFTYVVTEVHLRRENDVPLEERLAVGQFMAPMPEERLSLITCWPYGIDDHRLIVVAKPMVGVP